MPSIEYDDGGRASSLCADGLVIVDGIYGFVFRSNDMTTGGMVISSTTGGSVDGGGDIDTTLGIVGAIVLMVPLVVPIAGRNVSNGAGGSDKRGGNVLGDDTGGGVSAGVAPPSPPAPITIVNVAIAQFAPFVLHVS
jgi:hypothetical protein